jgi:hypothetical protein
MKRPTPEHGLEFLLAFDGRIHHLEKGYWLKFEITRGEATAERPHGLSYSFTLHAPDGRRLIGFDNAHDVPHRGSRFKRRGKASDHWHRTETDPGRPYVFKDAATLIDDFFDEVERVLTERGISLRVIAEEGTERSK